jgi:hypothetical protein
MVCLEESYGPCRECRDYYPSQEHTHPPSFCTVILVFKIVFHSFNFPQAEMMIIRNSEVEQLRRSSGFQSTV